jgi:hypothetical protein
MIKVKDIVFEMGQFWVLDTHDSYSVMKIGPTCSTSNSSHAHDEDGLSIAIAYCKYLDEAKRRKKEIK